MLPVPHLRLVLTCQGPEEEVAAQAVELRGQYPDHQLGLPQSPFRPRGRGRTSQPKIWLPGLATKADCFKSYIRRTIINRLVNFSSALSDIFG